MMKELRFDRDEGGEIVATERTLSTEEIAAIRGPLADAKTERLAALAGIRWQATQAFTYDGVAGVPADSAMTAVLGVVVADTVAPTGGSITWKLKDGEFRTWSVDDVAAYGIAIRAHVQACFDNEQALSDAVLAAADFAGLDSIDLTSGWPA